MSYDGPTPTKFGRYQVAEPFRAERMFAYNGEKLKTTDWEPPIPVLDQEDLIAQGIDTSALIPGAAKVDALGSCTCQAGVGHLAERVHTERGHLPAGLSATDTVGNERQAISLYHAVTMQTGDPASEWPPADCGSSGLYVCDELEAQGEITGFTSPQDHLSVMLALQTGSVMVGCPWFNAWFEPDASGFVDGPGGWMALQSAIASGVAGGHETLITALEDVKQQVVRVRNSWSASWGDHGSYRIHLSTWYHLARWTDYKQAIVP